LLAVESGNRTPSCLAERQSTLSGIVFFQENLGKIALAGDIGMKRN